MAEYRSQHYVPRAYLQAFTDEAVGKAPYVWVYERGRGTPFRRAPKKLATSNYYYSIEDPQGNKIHDIEKWLGRLESEGIPLLRQLAEGQAPDALSQDDRARLSLFLAYMGQRVPAFRTHMEKQMGDLMKMVALVAASNKEYFNRTFKEAMAAAGKQTDVDPEEVRQSFLSDNFEVRGTPESSLQMMLTASQPVAEYIYNFEWRILEAPAGERFVTSDRPLVLVTTEKLPPPWGWGVGWFTPFMEATFPITPTCCLLISQHHPTGRESIPADRVREANVRTAAYSAEQVYSSRKIPLADLSPPADWAWWTPMSTAVDQRFLEGM